MSETDLKWRSPLDGVAVPGRYGNPEVAAPGVTLKVITGRDVVRISPFAGQRNPASAALRKVCNMALSTVGKSSTKAGTVVAWAALEAWVVMAPGEGRGAFFGKLDRALRATCAVVDHTHGVVGIHVSGPKSRALLAKGCSIDLEPSLFAVGACAATQMEHMGVHLRRAGEDDYELLVPTSQCGSFWHFLTEMALEFGFEVEPV